MDPEQVEWLGQYVVDVVAPRGGSEGSTREALNDKVYT